MIYNIQHYEDNIMILLHKIMYDENDEEEKQILVFQFKYYMKKLRNEKKLMKNS